MVKALALSAVFLLTACSPAPNPPAAAPSPVRDDVVHVTGHNGIRFGAHRTEIASYVNTDLPGCNSQLRGRTEGSLVFTADERVVLLWFDAPLQTPEGISTDDPVADVRAAYPSGTELKAPKGSYRFDGILVTSGEYGYLFLHDGKTVQKAIAGYVEYLHRLFNTGFGVC